MPSMTIVSVGRGKDGREKTKAVEIETTATLGAARKFAASYCADSPPPTFGGTEEAALDAAAARIVEANMTDADLRLAEAGNRDAQLKIEEAIWPVKRKVK